MKKAILLLTAILHTTGLLAQIPNAGFENWDTIAGVSKLTGWEVPNYATANDTFEWAKPDTLSGAGGYSVYISNEPRAGFEPTIGYIRTFFKSPNSSDTLLLYINIPNPMPMFARPAVSLGSRGITPYEQVDVFFDTNRTNGFEPWRIPFSFTSVPDSIELQIQVGSFSSYSKGAYFDNIVLQSYLDQTFFSPLKQTNIFPNPFHDKVFINSEAKFKSYSLYDMGGKFICEKLISSQNKINLRHINKGTYYIVLYGDKIHFEKIIKED